MACARFRDRLSPLYGSALPRVTVEAEHGRIMLPPWATMGLAFGELDPSQQTSRQAASTGEALGEVWMRDPPGLIRRRFGDEGFSGGDGLLWYSAVSFEGRLDNVNSAMSAMVYWPARNWNSAQSRTLDTIRVTVSLCCWPD